MIDGANPVLTTDLSVDYPQKQGVLKGARINVMPGEIFGLMGQSGSGKSTLALAILRLLDQIGGRANGRVELFGRNLAQCSERQMRSVRGAQISLIPQSPTLAMNPALSIETHLREAWRAHSREPWFQQKIRLKGLFSSAGLPSDQAFLRRYPNEISVGQAQRVLIVMALLHSPRLVIADEPTSALDLITQRDVLALLNGIRAQRRMSMLFISHDLPVIASICDRMAILHDGVIVECAPVKNLLSAPQHPFTRELIAAVPKW